MREKKNIIIKIKFKQCTNINKTKNDENEQSPTLSY